MLDAATSCNDFLLTGRAQEEDDHLHRYPAEQAGQLLRLIVNLFFSQLINVNTWCRRPIPNSNHQCLLLMDEFTAIGKVDILASSEVVHGGVQPPVSS